MAEQWVYRFDDIAAAEASVGGSWDATRALLGGKGANLGEMTRAGVPVPPGFTLTTRACNAYLSADGQLPEGLWEQVLEALQAIEQATGKRFGDPANPLLVSSRSGAKFSMPGMMDTVLNIGLNDETAAGLVAATGDPRFVYDLYRRLLQMYGSVVMGVDDALFEEAIQEVKDARGLRDDTELTGEDWRGLTERFKQGVARLTGRPFPEAPEDQLRMAIEAVFKSWNGRRAVDYRRAAGIPNDLGTAVNIQTMVFGNMSADSGTGVTFTRDPATGEKVLYGDYLMNAQGEDVVAGIRNTRPIAKLAEDLPEVFEEFRVICDRLEQHYHEMQDVEFTIERGKLWMLQTRNGKRTSRAAVRIAVEMAREGLIEPKEAVRRVKPSDIDFFLHPQFDAAARKAAADQGRRLASGVNASPGAAVGVVAFDADTAEAWGKAGRDVIMVRVETKPDDVHGMLASKAILTSRGGATSHAAVVARQFGVPAVCGAEALAISVARKRFTAGDVTVVEGDTISVDGTSGEVFLGEIARVMPEMDDPHMTALLGWADEIRRLDVWANADTGADAQRARDFGARGIGLCRTEHMFFETDRLPIVRQMIMAGEDEAVRREALDKLLPIQREDFRDVLSAMDGLPVIIRMIDPPLHEFLPGHDRLVDALARAEVRGTDPEETERLRALLARVNELREANPMLGLRGVRLGMMFPGIIVMQVRALLEAACQLAREGLTVKPEIMIPLATHLNELTAMREIVETTAEEVFAAQGNRVDYKFGTMIEIPRAALVADQLASECEFFSFGTNDLTQTGYGISRDDAEQRFLLAYVERGILPANPFQTLDQEGIGQLVAMAVRRGRRTRPGMEMGVCGEHGGDPDSIHFFHHAGLDYVSCSPFRVPVARLAAAHAALEEPAG
ncbi:MAG: pyruvate, phosphate dikinase [Caldilineae bacterium]|nr:pyruvate, phosphate dikinase [Chloroflexota bacterium]MCB9176864.1 pyruvate, phosphate dikinase [Caldilineae bacterium]